MPWGRNTDVEAHKRADKTCKKGFDWGFQQKIYHLAESVLSSGGYLQRIFKVLDDLAGYRITDDMNLSLIPLS